MSRLDRVKNYKKYAQEVKRIVSFYDKEAKVILFGSTVRGDFTGASDIDILVVSKRKDLEYQIKLAIKRELLEAPIQIHFASPEEFDGWYKKFIDK